MELRVGDRLREPSGEWRIAARPYTANGVRVHARVRRVDDPRPRQPELERATSGSQ